MNQEDRLRTEVHTMLDAVAGPTPELLPAITPRLTPGSRRRPFLALAQVAGVLGIGLVVGIVVFSIHRSRVAPSTVSTSPTAPIVAGAGANVAWVTSQTASGDVVTGIDQAGHVVGRINAPVDLRSPDGSRLYALAGTEVRIYSAIDGHLEKIITLALMAGGVEMLSSDGRYLGVVSKSTLQLVDLTTGRLTDPIDVGSPAYGVPVIVGPQADHLYVVGDTVTRLAFDGARLRVEQRTTGHTLPCNGLVAGSVNSAGGLSFRVLADGHTLVAFCPMDGHVTWFDLDRMSVTHDLAVGQANPFWVSPVFSKDGSTLYLHEGGTGSLHVIDLVRRSVVRSTKVAMAEPNPLAWLGSLLVTTAYAGAIDRTAALSPDGTWLYAIGDFGARGGVSLVHLPDLVVKGRWIPNVSLGSITVSADGRTIFVLTQDADTVHVVRTDGSEVATLSLPANTFGFVVPTTP